MQSESTESVEIFKSWRISTFLYWSLKGTAFIRQITNNECQKTNNNESLQEELVNLYQFLYHVTSVGIFQVKSWFDSTFCCFVHRQLVSTLLKSNPAFYLVITQSFLNFPQIPWIDSAELIRGINGYFKNLIFFFFSFWNGKGTT